jgi:hypothetical protein
MKTKETAKPKTYVRPVMRTVVTPKEIRDIDQPCAFNEPGSNKAKRRPK